MAESYPHQQSATPGADADYQRLLTRLKQDEVQLVADQRQLRQQRTALEQLKTELDARQQELQRVAQTLQQERQALDGQKRAGADGLDAQRAALFRREEDLTQRAAQLDKTEQELKTQARQCSDRQRDLEAERQSLQSREAALRTERESLEARQRRFDEQRASFDRQAADLQTRVSNLAEQQQQRHRDAQDLTGQREQLQRREAELRDQATAISREKKAIADQQEALKTREGALAGGLAALADLQARQDQLAKDWGDLEAQGAALARRQEQAAAVEKGLAERQRRLEELEADLARQQRSAASEKAIEKGGPASVRDPQLVAAGEQIASQTRRVQALQVEVSQLRDEKQRILAQCDELAQQCSALQGEVDERAAVRKSGSVSSVSADPEPAGLADDIAALATQAAQARRRGVVAGRAAKTRVDRSLVVAAGVAVLAGLFVGLAMFGLLPGRYWLQARIVFAPESPLATRIELARAQRDLSGRLVEASVPGLQLPADRSPVTADTKAALLTVQVQTVAPELSKTSLQGVLTKYRSELEGGIQDAARAQQDRELADLVAATEMQLKAYAAERQALQGQAEKFQPQGKAYQDALAIAEKTRKALEEANRKNDDVAARLRVLRRTPPGTRVELSPERIASAAAADAQLAEVRGQVTSRANDLRTLLSGLLTSATVKCDQMDAQLDKFLQFLGGQQEQMTDEALRGETGGIAQQASQLRGVIQRCRKQINELSGVLARSQDVAQATLLVGVQAQSEKALESLTIEAADQIKQVDDLMEKIPAGGVDVTRRTVLQQRLRSRFAEVQKTQHEMNETLNGLRPAVNFRLDAALTAVSGLARRLQDRQKALAEQIQQQDAQSRRLDYDRQMQQAQGEFDEIAVERDRLMTGLTQATQEMLDADPGRTKLIEVRAHIDELDHKITADKTALEVARQKQTTLLVVATRPSVVRLEGVQVLQPAANRGTRMLAGALTGLVVTLLAMGGYVAATKGQRPRKTLASRPVEFAESRN